MFLVAVPTNILSSGNDAAAFRCPVTADNRKCRKCRFDRCLMIGMKSECVLDEEQKKERFKRFLKKRKREEMKFTQGPKSGNKRCRPKNDINVDEGGQPNVTFTKLEQEVRTDSWVVLSGETWKGKEDHEEAANEAVNEACSNILEDNRGADDVWSDFERKTSNGRLSVRFRSACKPEIFFTTQKVSEKLPSLSSLASPPPLVASGVRRTMIHIFERLGRTWVAARRRMNVSATFVAGMKALHLRGGSGGFAVLSKDSVKLLFLSLARLLGDFAQLQPEFWGLNEEDQSKLLVRNVPIFIQYLLVR